MTESVIAVVAGLVSAFGLKLIEKFFSRIDTKNQARRDAAQKAEDDRLAEVAKLRSELAMLASTIDALESEVLEWREKYFNTREEYIGKMSALADQIDRLRDLDGRIRSGTDPAGNVPTL